jgi:modulator of FtsH protease
MSLSGALLEWRDFYAVVGNAGAALLGLTFVAISIHVGRHPLDLRTRAPGTIAILALLHPVLASLVMLLPVAALVQGIVLLVMAGPGLVMATRIASFETRHPGRETRFMVAYRYFLPLAAEVILALAALALIVGSRLGLYALPVFMALMFIVGTQTAVDLLLGATATESFVFKDDSETQGHAPALDLDGGQPNPEVDQAAFR